MTTASTLTVARACGGAGLGELDAVERGAGAAGASAGGGAGAPSAGGAAALAAGQSGGTGPGGCRRSDHPETGRSRGASRLPGAACPAAGDGFRGGVGAPPGVPVAWRRCERASAGRRGGRGRGDRRHAFYAQRRPLPPEETGAVLVGAVDGDPDAQGAKGGEGGAAQEGGEGQQEENGDGGGGLHARSVRADAGRRRHQPFRGGAAADGAAGRAVLPGAETGLREPEASPRTR